MRIILSALLHNVMEEHLCYFTNGMAALVIASFSYLALNNFISHPFMKALCPNFYYSESSHLNRKLTMEKQKNGPACLVLGHWTKLDIAEETEGELEQMCMIICTAL